MLSGASGVNLGPGDVRVIAGSLFWALHVFFVGRIAERIGGPFLVACGPFLVCGMACPRWVGLTETMSLAGIRRAARPILYTGVVAVGFAYTGRWSARTTPPPPMRRSSCRLSPFAALFGFLMMGDRFSPMGIADCALISIGRVAGQMMPLMAAGGARRS